MKRIWMFVILAALFFGCAFCAFGAQDELSEAAGIPCELYDERLTTVSAHRILSDNNVRGKKRKAAVDALSARLILEDYLTLRRNRGIEP